MPIAGARGKGQCVGSERPRGGGIVEAVGDVSQLCRQLSDDLLIACRARRPKATASYVVRAGIGADGELDPSERIRSLGHGGVVGERLDQFERPLQRRPCTVEVAPCPAKVARRPQDPRPKLGRDVIGLLQQGLDPLAAFAGVRLNRLPEQPRPNQSKRAFDLPGRDAPLNRSSDVPELLLHRPGKVAVPARQLALGILQEIHAPGEMTGADGVPVRAAGEELDGVLPDRLQHPESFVAVPHQTLVHQRLKYVDVSAGHSLSRVDGATTLEYRKSREEVDLRGIEQLAGPFDRCAQRLLTRLDAAVPAEQIEPITEPGEYLSWGQNAGASRGEFECQRQVVQSVAELSDRLVRWGVRARAEQFDRIERRHWRHWILGFSCNPKPFATSHEYVQIRAGLQHG